MAKNVLITGATGNLGQAVVARFISDGYHVIAAVSHGKKQSVPDGVTAIEADLTNEKEAESLVRQCIEQFGQLDAALLLVGGFASGSVAQTDGAALTKMISLNFDTTYFVARPVFAQMKKQASGGTIVMIGSRPALSPKDGKSLVAYTLAKSMVLRLAELLNADAAGTDVVVSVIAPGTIDTPANRRDMPDADKSKWVSPESIANAMVFLCAPENRALREPVLKMYGRS